MDIQTINTDSLGFRIVDVQDEFIIVHKASGLGFHDESSFEELHANDSDSPQADADLISTRELRTPSDLAAPALDLTSRRIELDLTRYLGKVDEDRFKTSVGLCNRLNALLSCGAFEFSAKNSPDGVVVQPLNGRAFPVHRLDKPTSGLLVFGRSTAAAAELSDLFASQQIQKTYIALSDKKPKKKQGAIVGDMVKSRRSAWKLLKSKNKPARTSFVSKSVAPSLRLFALSPKTGRTHQLRVAMKSLGAPILGDALYGGTQKPGLPLLLHAARLGFKFGAQDHHYQQLPDLNSGISDISSGDGITEKSIYTVNDLSPASEPFSFKWSFDDLAIQEAVSAGIEQLISNPNTQV